MLITPLHCLSLPLLKQARKVSGWASSSGRQMANSTSRTVRFKCPCICKA
jgi:hypothetical protein